MIDVRDFKKLEKRINQIKPSIIFHLAAQPLIYESYKNPYDTIDINAKGTLNIMEIVRKSKFVKSVIIVTSINVMKAIILQKVLKKATD